MSIKGTDLNQVLDVKREMTDIKMVIKLLMDRTEGIQANIGELATAVAEQHQLEMENVDLVGSGEVELSRKAPTTLSKPLPTSA